MARPKSLKPKHCHHKATGRGFVIFNGEWKYTGPWGSQIAQDEYDRLIGEWIASGRYLAPNRSAAAAAAQSGAGGSLTVNSVLAAYWVHAQAYYVKPDGAQTTEVDNIRQAIRPVRRFYGRTPAAEFGPRALKVLQQEMVRLGWCRTNINRNTNRIKGIFKWAASEEVIPPGIYHGLLTVRGLPKGRGGVGEKDPVRPAAEAAVDATVPIMPAAVAAMVNLQLLTGMRPGEVFRAAYSALPSSPHGRRESSS